MTKRRWSWRRATTGLAAFGLGFTAVALLPPLPITPPSPPEPPTSKRPSGIELVLVYVGSATCGPSNHPAIPVHLARAQQLLAQRAAVDSFGFSSLGIARDWNVELGVDHLSRTGAFDEIAAGRSWYNVAALRYIWDHIPGVAATPQLLVVLRPFHPATSATESPLKEVLLARAVGTAEIARWVQAGAPLRPPEDTAAHGVVSGR